MGVWRCGRCKGFIKALFMDKFDGYRSYCECKRTVPAWFIPTKLIEKFKCLIGKCRYIGTCNDCDKGPF